MLSVKYLKMEVAKIRDTRIRYAQALAVQMVKKVIFARLTIEEGDRI